MYRQRGLIFFTLCSLLLASLACNVPDALTNIDPTAVAAIDTTQLAAQARDDAFVRLSDHEYCPGQVMTITWDGGGQDRGCSHGLGLEPVTCRWGVIIGDYDMPMSYSDEALGGSDEFAAVSLRGIRVEYRVGYPGGDASDRTYAYESADVIQPAHLGSTQELICDPATLTWQWEGGELAYTDVDHSGQAVNLNPCQAITEVCTTASPARLTADDGTVIELAANQCTSAFAGYLPSQIDIVPTNAELANLAGGACSPGDDPPSDPNWGNGFLVAYRMSCSTANQMVGDAADDCAEIMLSTTVEAITSDDGSTPTPTAPPSGIVPICQCGNGVCEADCEDSSTCAADCAATNNLCADHGGVAWQGTTCVCPGLVDEVTICGDNTKFDNVTDASCTPADPAACQASSGDPAPTAACNCVCVAWSQVSFPPTCLKWADCNGNTC